VVTGIQMIYFDYIRRNKPHIKVLIFGRILMYLLAGNLKLVAGLALFILVLPLAILSLSEQNRPVEQVEVPVPAPMKVVKVVKKVEPVIVLSEKSPAESELSNLGLISDLSPTLDAVSEVFQQFSVKKITMARPDSSHKEWVDSFAMNYQPPVDHENVTFKRQVLAEIPSGSPVTFKGVTSSFGNRIHPLHKIKRKHNGVDLRAVIGTPVVSTADGVIEFAGSMKKHRAFGKFIVVYHNHGFQTQYGHLKEILVKQGDFVKKGEVIGISGNTGFTDGPHLHYEVHFLQKAKDPLHFVRWTEKDFDSLFRVEKGVKWIRLVDRIVARMQNMQRSSHQLAQQIESSFPVKGGG
jgi:murein DD-endopeptidase MepM/ murein hydrolase activator NlpD